MTSQDKSFNFTKKSLDALPSPAVGKRLYVYDTKVRGLELMVTEQGAKSFKVYRKWNLSYMDDEKIVELIRNGNTEAFEELVLRYQKKTHFFALRNINNWDAADDITQAAFIKLYSFIMKSNEKINISAWMHRVITNLCIDNSLHYITIY